MKDQRLEYLITKYTSDIITDEEETELMQLIRQNENSAHLEELMIRAWDDKKTDWVMSEEKADDIFNEVVSNNSNSGDVNSYLWILKIAGVLLVCFSFLFFIYKNSLSISQSDKVATRLEVHTKNEHRKVKLPDGSIVILNERSSIEYPENFNGALREVVLKGEGYFDIRHDAKHSFIVRTGNIKTTVLGTAFNIKAFEGKAIEVTVTRGKVSVTDENKVIAVLEPDEQVIFNHQQKTANITKVLAEEAVAWQKNDLFFEETTMEEAAAELSRKFNVKITFINNKGKKCRFTATFLKDQSLEEIIKVITAFNGASYKMKPGEINIIGADCEN